MRITNLVLEDLTEALNRGMATWDSKSVFVLQRERAGIAPFKVPANDIRAVEQG